MDAMTYIASAVPIPYEPNRFTISPRPPGPRSRAWYSTRAGVACSTMIDWHKYLIMDFEAGTLTWRRRPLSSFFDVRACNTWNTKFAGTIAGSESCGYRKIKFNGKHHPIHRIIYEMANGPIPAGLHIDHINTNPLDNRLCNLRLATNAENCMNRGANRNNTTGFKGVHRHGSGFRARIHVDGKPTNLGTHSTPELAAEAYAAASKVHHREFARVTLSDHHRNEKPKP